jgi:hypothetical protein
MRYIDDLMQIPTLSSALNSADFVSLTLCRSGDQWQANLLVEKGGGWCVRVGATPAEALLDVLLGWVPADAPVLPPPPSDAPYPVPPPPPY